MLKQKLSSWSLLTVVFCQLMAVQQLSGQYTTQRDVRISLMWNQFENLGGGGWERTWSWPADGRRRYRTNTELRDLLNACARKFGPSIGVQNWTNQRGQTFSYYIAGPGSNSLTRNCGDGSGLPGQIQVILRTAPPSITVDGSQNLQTQTYDMIDPKIPSDAEVKWQYNYAIGLTCNTTVYIYAPQNDRSNSYIYYDFWFVNTGKFRPEPDSVAFPGQTLHKLGITFSLWPMVAFEGATEYGRIWEDRNDDWTDYYGATYPEYLGAGTPLHPLGNPSADSLRLTIDWDGTPPVPATDDIGDPDDNTGWVQPSTGHGKLLSYQYAGYGVLWADKSATDHTNDLSQPFATTWVAGSRGPLPFLFADWYKLLFTPGHKPGPTEMGFTDPTNPSTVAAPFPYESVGLYDIPYGDSVHVVIGAAVGGISQQEALRVGTSWWGYHTFGSGLTDSQKDSVVATGRDSLFLTYSLATKRFFGNIEAGRSPFAAPSAPPSPNLEVTSGIQAVKLTWSDVSQVPNYVTGVKDFAGYKVYRRQVSDDSLWTLVWDSRRAGTPYATSYTDSSIARGLSYVYAVTAYNDGTQNWRDPGHSLESSIFWNMMPVTSPAHGYLGAATNLSNIRVVPNPFNANSAPLNFPGEPNKILFAGLPGQCTIKIYTVTGNLVKTIEHTNGTAEESWNQVTDYNQLIPTGVYIAVVESGMGKSFVKFVVVR